MTNFIRKTFSLDQPTLDIIKWFEDKGLTQSEAVKKSLVVFKEEFLKEVIND